LGGDLAEVVVELLHDYIEWKVTKTAIFLVKTCFSQSGYALDTDSGGGDGGPKGTDNPDECPKGAAPPFPRALCRRQRGFRIWRGGSDPLFKFLV